MCSQAETQRVSDVPAEVSLFPFESTANKDEGRNKAKKKSVARRTITKGSRVIHYVL